MIHVGDALVTIATAVAVIAVDDDVAASVRGRMHLLDYKHR
jgi:hypothetical protein